MNTINNTTTVLNNNKETNMSLGMKLNAAFGNDWFIMAGTEGTFEYVVLAATELGRVGYRDFTHSGSPLRIRVEPAGRFYLSGAGLDRETGWKQPGDSGQWRYSRVLPAGEMALEGLKKALRAIQAGRRETLVSLGASQEVKAFVAAEAADEERIRRENEEMEKRNAAIRTMLKYPVYGKMSMEADTLRAVAAGKREEAARLLAEAEQAELEAARIMAAAERLRQALDEAESLGFPLNPPFIPMVEKDLGDDDELEWTEDDDINAGLADGEDEDGEDEEEMMWTEDDDFFKSVTIVTGDEEALLRAELEEFAKLPEIEDPKDPALRREELMAKKASELNKNLKEKTGAGILRGTKNAIIDAILRAEGYEV